MILKELCKHNIVEHMQTHGSRASCDTLIEAVKFLNQAICMKIVPVLVRGKELLRLWEHQWVFEHGDDLSTVPHLLCSCQLPYSILTHTASMVEQGVYGPGIHHALAAMASMYFWLDKG